MPKGITDQVKAHNVFTEIVFGPDILDAIINLHGKDAWNCWVEKAWQFAGASSFPAKNEECEPIAMECDFRGHDFSGRDLSGLDLSIADMSGAILRGCNLRNSELGMITGADLRGADLTGATIDSVIDGADFTGCSLTGTRFDDPWLTVGEPLPIGLSEEILAACKHEPKEDAGGDMMAVPIKVMGSRMVSFWGGFPNAVEDVCPSTRAD